jgi:hypothetical protein
LTNTLLPYHQSTDPTLSLSLDPLVRWPLHPLTFTAQPWVVLRDLQKHPQGSNVSRWPASESELFFPFFGELTLRFLIRDLPTECTKQLKGCGRMVNFLWHFNASSRRAGASLACEVVNLSCAVWSQLT